MNNESKNINSRLKKIHMMPPSIERSLEMYHLDQYLLFLSDKGTISKDDYQRITKEIDYKSSKRKYSINDVDDTIVQLTCLYEEVLKYSNNFTLFRIYPEINYKEYLSYVMEFFKYIDMNLFKLFCEFRNNGLLSIVNNYDEYISGSTYDIGKGKSGILLERNTYFNLIRYLIHEVGHAYDNHLSQAYPYVKINSFGQECLSITLELLFMKFIRDNHLGNNTINDMIERCVYTDKLRLMNSAYIFNNFVFIDKKNKYDEINAYYFRMPLNTYERLGLIKMNQKAYGLDKIKVSNYDNFYGYGLLFSLVILDMFDKDEKEARNIIKSFPSFAKTHKGIELITRFTDDEYLEDNKKFANRVLSKTYYKKR